MTNREHQVKQIVLTAVDPCSACGQHYVLDNIDVVGNRGNLWMLTFYCSHCQQRGFVAALVTKGETEAELAGELTTGHEAKYRHDSAPISAEDVLAMRDFLAHFDGDFQRHFRQQHQA